VATHLYSTTPPPGPCLVCGAIVQPESALADWQLCSTRCSAEDREQRYQAPRPAKLVLGERPTEDWLEEQRQIHREVRLEEALLARHLLGSPEELEDRHWFELAEADLGNYQGQAIARRIRELAGFYRMKLAIHPDRCEHHLAAALGRIWSFVPRHMIKIPPPSGR
jgi:predicted nucleic acid-binding Zn ribbon protein